MQPVKCKACGKIQDNLMSENGRLYACEAREVTGYVCQHCHKRQSWGVRGGMIKDGTWVNVGEAHPNDEKFK